MKQTGTFVVSLEQQAIHRGPLVLVNKDNPMRGGVSEERLAEIAPGIRLEKQAAILYGRVMQALDAGPHIIPVSGYRSRTEQEKLFAEALCAYGEAHTRTYVALPGCSEHQTGLALDMGKSGETLDFITPDFPYHGVCQSFREASVRFGFIQRYPKGREEITGIGHEPWHFRYVGIPHAGLITERGLTLEEYTGWIQAFPLEKRPYRCQLQGRGFTVGFVPAKSDVTKISVRGGPYTISGNNVDGFIVAEWGCAS